MATEAHKCEKQISDGLSEKECRQLWAALDGFYYYGDGSHVDAAKIIDAVVDAIAEERARPAREWIAYHGAHEMTGACLECGKYSECDPSCERGQEIARLKP